MRGTDSAMPASADRFWSVRDSEAWCDDRATRIVPCRPGDMRELDAVSSRIVVDPIKCEAHGLCAELLPERISLDEWGYPLIDPDPVPSTLEDLARRAAEACPTLALKLEAAQNRARAAGPSEGLGRKLPPARRPAYRVHKSGR